METVIAALLLAACVDNRNDFAGASATSNEPTTNSLPAPENLSATTSDNEVSLSWDTVDGATAYNVYIYSESGYIQANHSSANLGAANTDDSTRVSINSHFLSSLQYEVDYYFNVTALDDVLESDQSNEVGVRPLQDLINSTPSVQLADTVVNAAEVVTLSAEVSDPDGNEVSYLWQQISGENVDIENSDQPEAYFTAPIVGAPTDLGFVVTVSDGYSASNSNVATITISDNLVPEVDAGADQSVSSGTTVELLGRVSDSDGSVVDITWQQESGSIVSLSSTSTLATSFTAPSDNSSELTLVFQLSATDDRGDSATDTVTVLVAADQDPTIVYRVDVAENSNGTIHVATTMDPEQESLTYSLSGTDADDFAIDSSSGAISFVSTPDYETPTDTNTDNVYELTFEVSNGTTTTLQELVITVIDVDEAPTITSAASASVSENTTTTIYSATATDPENNSLTYSLSGTDAANFSIDPGSGAISFTTIPDYENPADSQANNLYSLTLEVSDSTHTISQALTIAVTNIDEPPTITSATAASIPENTTTTIYTASASDPENGALSYSLSATDAANFSIDSSSGAISFAINPDYENPTDADANNVYQLTLEVSDSTHTISQAFDITVNDTNDNAPIITAAQSFSIDENSANGSAIGTVVATDADSSPTTYQDWTITSGNTNAAFAIDSSSGELSVAASSQLDHESTASYTLELSVSDGVNTASTETLSINVNDVNDNAPIIAAAQSFSIDENSANGTAIGTVVATDADTSPTTYQDWTITSGNTEAAFAIDSSSGELSVATSAELDYESTASYTLALSVSDGVNSASAETLSINLSNVNEQPSFTSAATASANENDSSFAYTASAIDADAGDSLAYSISGGADAASFTFNLSGASLGFIAAANYESPADSNQDNIYEVELQVTDAGGLSDYLDLQISVANVNEAPSFISVDATVDVPENTSGTIYTLEASDTDSDDTDDTLTYSIAGGADKLSFSLDGAELSFINPPNYEAPQAAGSDANLYTVELAVSDDEGKASAANLILSFQVTDVNEAPSFTSVSGTYDVAENTSDTIFTLEASDTDSDDTDDTLTYSIAGGADRLSFSLAGNELSFAIPPPDYENPQAAGDDANIYTVELAVSDDDGKASETNLALSFNVTDVNEAPTINSTTNTSVPENTTTTIYSASATDPESDTLTYSLSGTDKDDFIIDPSSGALTFANTPNYEAPTDADSDNAYQITLEVSDGNANSATQALTISVTNVNEAPTITSAASASVPENTSGTIYNATTTDPENDTLTYALSGTDQDDFIIDPSRGAISFVNKPDHESPTDADTNNVYQVTLEVSDGNGNSASQALTITVTDINETPTITSATSASIPENNTTTIYTADATDPENDTLTYNLSGTDQDDFIIDPSSGALAFANIPNYEAPTDADNDNVYQITLEISDGNANTASQALTITVTDVNEAPTITSATSANILENNTTTIYTASATDPENDTLTYDISGTDKDDFIIDPSSGDISFANTPDHEAPTDANTNNVYQVTLEVSDGSNTVTQELTFTVTDSNEHSVSAPIDADGATNQIAENAAAETPVGITVSASDADGTNNSISYSFASNSPTSPDGLFGIDASTGVVSYNGSAALNYESGTTSYSFDIYASSSDGSSAHDSFTVAVIDINEDPVSTPTDANTAANEIAENSSANALVGITVSAIDPDGTNNAISYSFASNSPTSLDGLFDIDASTGVVSYNASAALNYESGTTSYSFDIYASSSDGSSTNDSFTVEVIDINEDPVSTPTDANTAANEIAENSSANALVGITVSATDPDGTNNAISYSFASNSPTSPDGLFDIDTSTGVVSYNASGVLNYESGTTSYSFDIYASSSDGSSAHDSFTVEVIDINEDPVSTPTDANTAANEIAENSSANALVGITASAIDPDGTNNAISYSFTSNSPTSPDGLFDIDASTGVVSYNGSAALNYESGTTSYSFDIYASSSDGSSTNDSFTVEVIDINEDPVSTPTDANTAANEIAENSSANALVGITVSATDPDGTNNAISYSFASNSPTSPDGLFDIDTSTGVVSYNASGVLNYESGTTSYSFDIYASSSDGSSAHDSFTVEVIDINEDPVSTPTDANTAANEIAENSSANALVGITASAIDPDGTNNAISYSFASNSPTSPDGLFDIDVSTGVVSYNGSAALNYESGTTSYSFDIYASSSDGSSTNDSFTVEVIDINEDPVSTPTDANTAANEIAENSSANALVGITVSATDPDGTNNAISYMLATRLPALMDYLILTPALVSLVITPVAS